MIQESKEVTKTTAVNSLIQTMLLIIITMLSLKQTMNGQIKKATARYSVKTGLKQGPKQSLELSFNSAASSFSGFNKEVIV